MDPLASKFTSLACKDLTLLGVCRWVQPARRFNSVRQCCAEFTVLDRVQLLPIRRPPRHHQTELEGDYHPVSGERLSPNQSTARPRAQPTITPRCGAQAWACRDRRAIAAQSNSAEDRRGAADNVRPGPRAGYNARHEGESRGQWERGEELRPLHHGWGWAEFGSGTAGLRRRGYGCGCWLAPSPPTLFGALSHSSFHILPRKSSQSWV